MELPTLIVTNNKFEGPRGETRQTISKQKCSDSHLGRSSEGKVEVYILDVTFSFQPVTYFQTLRILTKSFIIYGNYIYFSFISQLSWRSIN